MTLEEAASLALKVLKQVMEEKLDENNVQLAQVSTTSAKRLRPELIRQVTPDHGFQILAEADLKARIEAIAA
jgi:20S proteasome subunit alpha 5